MDIIRVSLGDVNEDPDDVGAVNHVDRRSLSTRGQVGARCMAVGSPMEGSTKSPVFALHTTTMPSSGLVRVM